MSQNTLVVSTTPPLAGLTMVNAVNAALNTLKTNNSGASEPSAPEAHMIWADTVNSSMKQRNSANTAWNELWKLNAPLSVTTQVTGDNTTKVASTAFVQQEIADRGKVAVVAPVTLTGVSVDFTGIPTWAKRVTVLLKETSLSGVSPLILRLGSSGGVEATGYLCNLSTANGAAISTAAATTSHQLTTTIAATSQVYGKIVIEHLSGNSFIITSNLGRNDAAYHFTGTGAKDLAGVFDRLRLTTISGTDTFDNGSASLYIEG